MQEIVNEVMTFVVSISIRNTFELGYISRNYGEMKIYVLEYCHKLPFVPPDTGLSFGSIAGRNSSGLRHFQEMHPSSQGIELLENENPFTESLKGHRGGIKSSHMYPY